jgi:hypothetical protein
MYNKEMKKRSLTILIFISWLIDACVPFPPSHTPIPINTPTIFIPALEDWDAGNLAFSHGAEGEWDDILWGGFANAFVKKGDTYYQGSPYYDNQCESVAHRSIGVATSTDGMTWVKYEGNPVITWSSQGSVEEGAVSSAAWLDADGKFYIYYGANTGTSCNINSSARLAMSEDGFNFQDMGEVLSGSNLSVWGSGDELFPVGAYSYNNQWNLYYIPNGVALSRKLGVASGSSPVIFTQSAGLNDSTIPAWGPVSIILDGPNSILFTNPNDGTATMNIYLFNTGNPSLVQYYGSYALSNCTQPAVFEEIRGSGHHWMLACRDQNAENYYIRNAFLP